MDKGAHYYRCDLQIHTPRDLNWKGPDCVSIEERHTYATQLVLACRERGLHAIAITDHHDMAFVDYIRDAAANETNEHGERMPQDQRLVVFPGMELTLSVPCQALLIFDANLPADLFALALTALSIDPSKKNEAKTKPVKRLKYIQSLNQLRERLNEHDYLRGRYIIFPNVGESGNFSLIRKGLANKYSEMHCVGGYVDGKIEKLGKGRRCIIDGKDREWGNKRIACFQTSDNRSHDHGILGSSTTWIKWATPTAEALRQACLAQESRVSQTYPLLPSVTITSLSVSNSSFLGPIDLQFNPQYSTLIGGRGTGKSTILEYLRWGVCDQPPQGMGLEDPPNYLSRRKRLIDQTLRPFSATTEVRFAVNGVPHLVRRNSKTGELLIKIAAGDMRPCKEEEIRRLLPIQAYSQKQLSNVSVRVEELSRFVTTPIRSQLDNIDKQIEDRAEKIRETYVAVRRRRRLARMLNERRLAENSLNEQSEVLKSGLTGLTPEDRELLKRGKGFLVGDQAIQSWRDAVETLRDAGENFRSAIMSYLSQAQVPPKQPEGAILNDAFGEYEDFLTSAKSSIDELIARAEAIISNASDAKSDNNPWGLWKVKLSKFRRAYDAAVLRSSTHKETMKNLSATEARLQQHVRETTRLSDRLQSIASAENIHNNERASWEQLAEERDNLLDEQCTRLTQDAGGAIRAQVKRYADAKDFKDLLKKILGGARIPRSRIDKLAKSITMAETPQDAGSRWKAILADLERLAEFNEQRDGVDQRPEVPALKRYGLTTKNIDGIGRILSPDDWLTLSLTPIKSEPFFEYQAREKEYMPFRNASAGQQATALLKTLLNQAGPPLIIDQPEEDLDNPVMLEIVERIWKAKQTRQLIFASHNANLVVNGDAELVAWCNHRTAGDQSRGRVEGEGAIDVSDVRDAIKRIMEGGEEAFNLRKEKYGF